MKLSKNQLNGLMVVLPRVKISHLLKMSTWCPVPFDTLMNIRTAGKQRKVASAESITQWIEEVLIPMAQQFLEEVIEDGFNKEEKENVDSLQKIVDGKYNKDFFGEISNYAKLLKGLSEKGGIKRTMDDAAADILVLLSTGTISSRGGDIIEEDFQKMKQEGFSGSLYNYLQKIDGVPGAGAFKKGIETVARNGIATMTRSKLEQQGHKEKSIQENTGEGEVDLGDIEPEEYAETQLHQPGEEEEFKTDNKESRTVEEYQRKLSQIKQQIPKIVRKYVPKKTVGDERVEDEERIEKTIFAITNALENPLFIKDQPVARRAQSLKYYKEHEAEMKKHGINSPQEYTELFSGNIWPRIVEEVSKLVGWEAPEKAKTAGVTLSHQLLKRAASKGKLGLLGIVCAIDPTKRRNGNVMVFERGRPKFAHVFAWNLHQGKIRIADVQDPDEDHLQEAYQAAFEAVQQEVFINNMQEPIQS